MPDPILRRATLDDAAGIVALLNGAYRGDSSRRGWTTEADFLGGQRTDLAEVRAALQDADIVMLVLDAGSIVGSVQVHRQGADAFIGMLAVAPDLQARGYGKQLLAAAEETATGALGSPTANMWVLTLRLELIAWYERRGYRMRPNRLAFPHQDSRFGRPKRPDLEFCLLSKELTIH